MELAVYYLHHQCLPAPNAVDHIVAFLSFCVQFLFWSIFTSAFSNALGNLLCLRKPAPNTSSENKKQYASLQYCLISTTALSCQGDNSQVQQSPQVPLFQFDVKTQCYACIRGHDYIWWKICCSSLIHKFISTINLLVKNWSLMYPS